MRLLSAEIENFRNLERTRLLFSPGVNVFLGGNGQGKTNLLEALHFPVLGRSHRGARDDDLIRFGAPFARVVVAAGREDRSESVWECALERGGERRLRLDGQPIRRRAELVGRLVTVVFDPAAVGIVAGGPEARRRFLDQGIAQIETDHLTHLLAYQRGLRQKARLLADWKRGGRRAEAREELAAWNRELSGHAAALCESRARHVAELGPPAATAHRTIALTNEEITISYIPRLRSCRQGGSGVDLAREIVAEFGYILPDEMARGRPLTGPHLDDVDVLLRGTSLRTFGSQGETRSAAIALKLAQGEVLLRRRGVRPVLFFDDIFSELDRERARHLQQMCAQEHQMLIATAREDDIAGWRPDGLRVWDVRAGSFEVRP
jgi:DNA replication and repair protein RecF